MTIVCLEFDLENIMNESDSDSDVKSSEEKSEDSYDVIDKTPPKPKAEIKEEPDGKVDSGSDKEKGDEEKPE